MHKIMYVLWCLLTIMYQSLYGMSRETLLPPGYGSTHFIIGQPIYKKQQHIPPVSLVPDSVEAILFSPDDDVCMHLLELINK